MMPEPGSPIPATMRFVTALPRSKMSARQPWRWRFVSATNAASFLRWRISAAIAEVEKKFTKKEGKPFAVVRLEDLMDMLEVVVWNEVYLKVSDILVAGRVVELKATMDRRDEMLRATAVEIKPLVAARSNG